MPVVSTFFGIIIRMFAVNMESLISMRSIKGSKQLSPLTVRPLPVRCGLARHCA